MINELTDEKLDELMQEMIIKVPQLRRLWTWKEGEETLQDNLKLSIAFNLLVAARLNAIRQVLTLMDELSPDELKAELEREIR